MRQISDEALEEIALGAAVWGNGGGGSVHRQADGHAGDARTGRSTCSMPPIMRTPEALAVWGLRYFGYDVEYVPMV
jgi:DUF917 family protein